LDKVLVDDEVVGMMAVVAPVGIILSGVDRYRLAEEFNAGLLQDLYGFR
jgi:hypothetical protein